MALMEVGCQKEGEKQEGRLTFAYIQKTDMCSTGFCAKNLTNPFYGLN